ncbi:MAG: hypothetical protein JXP72_09875 [Coriobacteriia bacterium]|jgi:hypothetical protein|nr:hypothetical protein [Coriobacteriia bacterium]
MVKKETCPVCKGNKVMPVESQPGHKEWRPCNGCSGSGFQVRVVHGMGVGIPSGFSGRY